VPPAVLLLAVSWLGAASLHNPSDAPTPEWREGPIRYIITKSEDKEYRQLETEEERRRAVEAFWLRRDPTPDTPGNELRAQFWRRVREATRQYGKDTTRPGWLTDMGKIYVLFGPPDEISSDVMAEGRRDIIVWIYRNTPSVGGADVLGGPNQVIAFAEDGSGDYRLTAEPSKVADVWEGSIFEPQPAMGLFKAFENRQRMLREAFAQATGMTDPVIRAHGGPATGGALGLTMTLARLQQPPEEWELTGEVMTREFFGSLPFRARADFFKTSGETTHVLLTVALRSSSVRYRRTALGEEANVQVYARILDSTATQPVLSLERESDFAPAPENRAAGLDDDLVYQSRLTLPPGAYLARLTVLDQVSGRTSSSDTPFTVPDFSGGRLGLSSVALARSIAQDEADQQTVAGAYRFGSLRIVPRLGQTFRPGESLGFYYQVYGAEHEPASGQPRLDVSYIFLAAEGEEIREIGRVTFEDQQSEAHGYSLPLEGWPAGQYLVRIEVKDEIASAAISRDLAFRIIDDS
jgi:GWxTD domain-containing protein